MHFRMLAVAFCALAGLAGNLQAAITYQYVTDQTTYSANPGDSIIISLFLQETVTGTRVGSGTTAQNNTLIGVANAANGNVAGSYPMSSISIGVNRTSGDSLFNQNAAGNSFNQSFNLTSDPDTFTQIYASADGKDGGILVAAVNGFQRAAMVSNTGSGSTQVTVYRLLVGTLELTAGSQSGTYSLVGGNLANKETSAGSNGKGTVASRIATNELISLDPTTGTTLSGATFSGTTANPYSFTVNVAAVPEPSSMVLGGMVVIGGAFGAWRRRKTGEPITVA